jgi:purine-binding chemotaxis protein CheW
MRDNSEGEAHKPDGQESAGSEISPDNRWETILSRLETSRAVLEKGFQPSVKEKAETLAARARALAEEEDKTDEADAGVEILEFQLSDERYALELRHINEVCPLEDLTPIPGTPPFVLGIINVRGEILSIIDLKKFFELPETGITDLNRVIIVQSSEMEFGILADEILGVRSIALKETQSSLPTLTGVRAEYFKGVTGDRVVILDGEKILSDKNIVVRTATETLA